MRRFHVLLVAGALGCDADPELPAAETEDGEGETEDVDTDDGESSGEETGVGEIVCDDEPVITYDTFGRGFLAAYCNGCHGGEVVDRKGAPPAVVFDDPEIVSTFAERMLVRIDPGDDVTPPMPPNGGPTLDDLDRARIWLSCYP